MEEQNWDFENAEVREPVPADKRRSILSVAFTPDELAAVGEKARMEGKPTSRYVHDQALAKLKVPTWRVLDEGNVSLSVTT